MADLSPEDLHRLTVSRVVRVNGSLNLEHGHTNYTTTHQANGSTTLSVVTISYPFCECSEPQCDVRNTPSILRHHENPDNEGRVVSVSAP